jgi:hypothetical protein
VTASFEQLTDSLTASVTFSTSILFCSKVRPSNISICTNGIIQTKPPYEFRYLLFLFAKERKIPAKEIDANKMESLHTKVFSRVLGQNISARYF